MGAMTPTTEQEIVIYGASGYTGRLVAAELAGRGASIVLAGRSRAKLEAVGEKLGPAAQTRVAVVALDDAAGLSGLIEPAAVVIACAGPFTLHGGPVIETAARAGTHYLDTTGEQPFIRDSFDRWGRIAAESGAALLSGFGFDYVPGDMLAALTAEGLGRVDEMTLAYHVKDLGVTRGTALSTLEMIKGGDVEWRRGRYEPSSRRAGRGRFQFPPPIGSRRVCRYPSGEQITVPKHVDVGTIRSVIDPGALLNAPLGPLAAPLMTAGGYAMSTPLRVAAGKLIARLPEGPSERARTNASFTIACEAKTASRTRTGVLRGNDVYGLTAKILAEGATRMAGPEFDRSGALAPAQAFDPAAFLSALGPSGTTTEIEPI